MHMFLPPTALQKIRFEELDAECFAQLLARAEIAAEIQENIFARAIAKAFGEEK